MKYAIVRTGGKQYKVSEGDILEVDNLNVEKDAKLVLDDVLLVVSDNSVKIGKPNVTGQKVSAIVLDNIRGEKIRVSKYKSKVRFRRTTGFRASLSKIKIESI
jgi:large subunit ribosomal protein L21